MALSPAKNLAYGANPIPPFGKEFHLVPPRVMEMFLFRSLITKSDFAACFRRGQGPHGFPSVEIHPQQTHSWRQRRCASADGVRGVCFVLLSGKSPLPFTLCIARPPRMKEILLKGYCGVTVSLTSFLALLIRSKARSHGRKERCPNVFVSDSFDSSCSTGNNPVANELFFI